MYVRRSAPERVAGGGVPGLEAGGEPLGPLRRGAVGPGLGVHADARAGLDPIVPDGGGGPEALLDVARLEVTLLVCRLGPHAGQAVRLKLELHRQLVLAARVLLLELADLALDPREVLDVVRDLVRDHVCLREVAGSAEAVAELPEEVRVQVDLLIGRAVERTGR